MKLSALQQSFKNRRSNSFRANGPLDSSVDGAFKSPASLFWLVFHGVCCLISLVLGFRFSRVVFFLLFSTNSITSTTNILTAAPLLKTTSDVSETLTRPLLNPETDFHRTSATNTISHVVVGRHGIRIRPWPHPNPIEVMKAHHILDRVQREQRIQYGTKNQKPLIVVTPTYVRTFQTLYLTGLMHSLMLVPYDLVWIVVEAGGATNETAALIAKSVLPAVHVGFDEPMPISWEDRHRMEARMRLHALRIVRDQRLEGIVMFADDSNVHSMELFDEIQSVKWFGAVSVGILAHSGKSKESMSLSQKKEIEENLPVPFQGPACNSSGQLIGWHSYNSLPYAEKSATYIDDSATVQPKQLEWAGFVLNARLVWEEADDKPKWAHDLDTLTGNGEELESPLSLLKDAHFVEPLGSCGRKVMVWCLRVEARADSKFPPGWIIDPPLKVSVPARHTPWPDVAPDFLPYEKVNAIHDNTNKNPIKTRSSRSRHGSRGKRKHESRIVDTQVFLRHTDLLRESN